MTEKQRVESPLSVRIENVTKSYHKGEELVTPLRNISMVIGEGDFLTLMGPSGSGKSTLLNLVAGIDKPDRGSIFVDGSEITLYHEDDLAEWRSRTIGYIFQQFNLIPVLTARENIELQLRLLPIKASKRNQLIETSLEIVGLKDRAGFYPGQLSGGQEQRVAIARAIACDPPIILADEPTGSLDRENSESVMSLFQELNQKFNKTIIIVTHDIHVAEYASRILSLDKGELTERSPEK